MQCARFSPARVAVNRRVAVAKVSSPRRVAAAAVNGDGLPIDLRGK